MLATLDALLAQPLLLLILLAVGAAIGIAVEKYFAGIEREQRRAYWRGRKAAEPKVKGKVVPIKDREAPAIDVAAEQLKTVMAAAFKRQALLNRPERRLLACIEKALAEHAPGWRAMGQVSLGEVLYSQDKAAYWAINAKRVDLLIVDAECAPVCAIEFQGTGHHAGQEAAARDAVKKEALRRAGIRYQEVVSGDTPAEVREMVRKLVYNASRTAEGFGRKVAGGKGV